MFHKVKKVKPVKNYILSVFFVDGTEKIYDIEPLFEEIEAFNSFRIIPGLFEQVKVDVGGYGISWNDEIDLSCDELWDNGINTVTAVGLQTSDTIQARRKSS